jgi:hypothetical protein
MEVRGVSGPEDSFARGGSHTNDKVGENGLMADLPRFSDQESATDRDRIDFLRTDLDLCFTFVDLAETERASGDTDAAQSVLDKAEHGYSTITYFLPRVENDDQKQEIQRRLLELRVRLDAEKSHLARR